MPLESERHVQLVCHRSRRTIPDLDRSRPAPIARGTSLFIAARFCWLFFAIIINCHKSSPKPRQMACSPRLATSDDVDADPGSGPDGINYKLQKRVVCDYTNAVCGLLLRKTGNPSSGLESVQTDRQFVSWHRRGNPQR